MESFEGQNQHFELSAEVNCQPVKLVMNRLVQCIDPRQYLVASHILDQQGPPHVADKKERVILKTGQDLKYGPSQFRVFSLGAEVTSFTK